MAPLDLGHSSKTQIAPIPQKHCTDNTCNMASVECLYTLSLHLASCIVFPQQLGTFGLQALPNEVNDAKIGKM